MARRWIIRAVFMVPVLVCLVGCGHDDPSRVFLKNEKSIRNYVARVQADKIPVGADGGVLLLDVLAAHGATSVRKKGPCVVITFAFMPTDAVPELWYSPAGFEPLPDSLGALRAQSRSFKLTRIRDDWAYVEWDN